MKTAIQRWGDSFVIKIPDAFTDKISLWDKTYLELFVENDRIIIEAVSKSQNTSDASPDNINNEPDISGDLEKEYPDITKTNTWKLCGSLEVEKTDPRHIMGRDNNGHIITNYAEHIDEILIENIHV